MVAQEWKFESPYPPAARLLIISPVTHGEGVCMWGVCLCVGRLCQGDRVRVFGDRESGAEGKVATCCNTLFVLHKTTSCYTCGSPCRSKSENIKRARCGGVISTVQERGLSLPLNCSTRKLILRSLNCLITVSGAICREGLCQTTPSTPSSQVAKDLNI